jgi:hypothetical protein
MLKPHIVYHLKAFINTFHMGADRKAFYPRSILDIEMFPRIERVSIRGQNRLFSSRNPPLTHDLN